MKGSGRAFCAGGDIVQLHKLMNEGKCLGHVQHKIYISLFVDI
jgi:enoyl-CoA hydratase/carnithine racemase